jgi:hypothetical protein
MSDSLERALETARDVVANPEHYMNEIVEELARALLSLSREREGERDLCSAAGAGSFRGRQSLPAALQDWLIEIEEYLQDRHDIRDGAPGVPHPLPNEEMSLSNALKSALGEQP